MTDIDMSRAQRIAFADTTHLGRPRWTELAVYHTPDDPTGKRWLALSTGVSTKPGEVPIVDRLHAFALDRALELFDDSPIGLKVKAEARDWAEHHADQPGAQSGNVQQSADAFRGSTDAEAMAWLFGEGVSTRRIGEALGMGESTLRMAANKGHPVKVPLLAVVAYIDRERFRADTLGEQARG